MGVAPLMGVAWLMGAVGGLIMERLSLAEGPGNRDVVLDKWDLKAGAGERDL
jgi:hypothetical protein